MFIGRKPDGSIYGTWTSPQTADAYHIGLEEVPDNHPDIVEFHKPRARMPRVGKAVLDAVLNDPQVPASLKALLLVLPDTQQSVFLSVAVLGSER